MLGRWLGAGKNQSRLPGFFEDLNDSEDPKYHLSLFGKMVLSRFKDSRHNKELLKNSLNLPESDEELALTLQEIFATDPSMDGRTLDHLLASHTGLYGSEARLRLLKNRFLKHPYPVGAYGAAWTKGVWEDSLEWCVENSKKCAGVMQFISTGKTEIANGDKHSGLLTSDILGPEEVSGEGGEVVLTEVSAEGDIIIESDSSSSSSPSSSNSDSGKTNLTDSLSGSPGANSGSTGSKDPDGNPDTDSHFIQETAMQNTAAFIHCQHWCGTPQFCAELEEGVVEPVTVEAISAELGSNVAWNTWYREDRLGGVEAEDLIDIKSGDG